MALINMALGPITFYIGTLEEHYTRISRTNLGGVFGVTETQFVLMAIFIGEGLTEGRLSQMTLDDTSIKFG